MSSQVRPVGNGYLTHDILARPLAQDHPHRLRAVLDIGSGSSPIGQGRFPSGTTYVAADILQHPEVDIACTVLALPFRDRVFDLVLCLRVIQHLRDDTKALREIFRVTTHGGLVVLAVGNRSSWTLLNARMSRASWRARIPYDYYHPYVAREITYKMKDAGFEDVRVRGAFYLPEALNRLPLALARALLRPASGIDRILGSMPGLRTVGTNLLVWGHRP